MKKKKQQPEPLPTPAKYDSRIAFAIAYFLSEADADKYSAHVRAKGNTYNGGFFHGMPCGRDERFDHTDKALGRLYAVTE